MFTKKIIFLFFIFSLFLQTLFSTTVQADADFSIQVKIKELNVRSGPSTSFAIVAKIHKDEIYQVITQEGDWYKIKVNSNISGWVANWLVDKTKEKANISEGLISADILNLRESPSLTAKIIGQLPKGTKITINSIRDDWYKITHLNLTGWVAKKYINTSNPIVKVIINKTNIRSGPSTTFPIISHGAIGEVFPIVEVVGDWYKITLPNKQIGYVANWVVMTEGISSNLTHGIISYLKNKVIIIDPGHGGIDPGAEGRNFNTVEKKINLAVANNLAAKLKAAGAQVYLTRNDDRDVSLQRRVDLVKEKKGDLFISIHHNTNIDQTVNGTITYYYYDDSKKLAETIQKYLVQQIGLKNLNARYEDYFVLRENSVPAVIVEVGFLSNYYDELKIKNKSFQEKTAEGIFQGIVKYFQSKN